MNGEQQREFVAETLARVRSGQITRRQAARVLAALSLTLAGAPLIRQDLAAAPNSEPRDSEPVDTPE